MSAVSCHLAGAALAVFLAYRVIRDGWRGFGHRDRSQPRLRRSEILMRASGVQSPANSNERHADVG